MFPTEWFSRYIGHSTHKIHILVLLFVFLFVSVHAQQQQLQTGCVMKGVCGKDGSLRQNCEYNGPPEILPESRIQKFEHLCPRLFLGQRDNAVCCDEEQFEILEHQINLVEPILGKCPSCFSNFKNLWCQFACSPMQKHHVHVMETATENAVVENSSYITRVKYFLSPRFAYGLFDSCKNVQTTNGDFALSMLCGTSAEDCTAEKLYKNLGTYNRNIGVPFTIDVIISDDKHIQNHTIKSPLEAKAYPCNGSSDISSSACSCQDCPSACSNIQPYSAIGNLPFDWKDPVSCERIPGTCKIASMDCTVAMSLLAFGCICVTVMVIAVLHYALKKSTDEDELSNFKPTPTNFKSQEPEKERLHIEEWLIIICSNYGQFVARRPGFVFFTGLFFALFCSFGLFFIRLTTDPVELWSSPGSEARKQKTFFEENFMPFYRVEQFIVYPKNQAIFLRENVSVLMEQGYYGPIYRKEFLEDAFRLQNEVLKLTTKLDGKTISLQDICFRPLDPQNKNCAVMSIFNYFQNDITKLDITMEDDYMVDRDYLDHIMQCVKSPFVMSTKIQQSCLADFGGVIHPYVVLGDFNYTNNYESARGLVITILVNNHLIEKDKQAALAWETEFINHLKKVQNPNYTISFMAERSIEDEIARESKSDAFTVVISYMFMFIYVAFALGQYQVSDNQMCTLFVNSKFMLGIAGILVCALSVTSSIGLFAFYGIPATLIILEVQPFLVLAVGIDNIFIFVQAYQRRGDEVSQPLEHRMALICGEVIPSMLLSSLSECVCFFLGAMSSMPAVRVFSLYAGLAICFNFILQITCFVALFIADIKRQEAGRLEFCCCAQMPVESAHAESYMYSLFNKYYAPFLLRKPVRFTMILIFLAWFTSSVWVVNKIELGLDQKMAVPEDSYVLSHFKNMDRFLSVGPPLYFVLKGPFDYSDRNLQNLICSVGGCSKTSLGSQVAHAARWQDRSYIAQPTMNWLDAYIDWLRPYGNPQCCRTYADGQFCPASEKNTTCYSCDVPYIDHRPRPDLFYEHISSFLSDNPSIDCINGGHAAYGSALKRAQQSKRVTSSYFMTYHTVLKTSEDFIHAMESAKFLAKNISCTINSQLALLGYSPIEVFPYSTYYVFYEQYEHIVWASIIQLMLSIGAIFVVTTILLGLDPWSAAIIVVTIASILINLIGLMYWWSIDFNAISVVNLVMSVGISVEFCSHIVRAFALSLQRSRLERAREALSNIGCSVLSGITLTKFGGIIVLAFAHSQIFKVFYFRMFFGIVVIGATHGLIFLPVLLTFLGPPVNKRRLRIVMEEDNCYKTKLKECFTPTKDLSVMQKLVYS